MELFLSNLSALLFDLLDPMSSVTDEMQSLGFHDVAESYENTALRLIFQHLETARSSLLKDVELLDYFSRNCEDFINRLMRLRRPNYDPFGGRPTYNPLQVGLLLSCYQHFYYHLKRLHESQCCSIYRELLGPFHRLLTCDNRVYGDIYMQLADIESKILSLVDKINASCSNSPDCLTHSCVMIHNQEDIAQGSLQDAAETIHRIFAGRQALQADFNSYIESPTTPAFNSFLVGGFHRRYSMLATSSISRSAVHNQNITPCPHTDAWIIRPVIPIFSESPTYPIESRYFAWGFNEEAYSLNQTNATSSNPRYFHSSAVHNHQNITQWHHLGWDEGTIQLVTRTLTDPMELQAYFNSDIESVTTPLNSETIEANATSSHNQNVTQGPLNSTRVEEQSLFNQPRFLETFLAITSQAALTMLTIQTSGGSTSFSQNQKILFCSAVAFNVIGFLSFLSAILVRGRRPGIARIVTGTGFICTAYAFIGIMGMLLKDNIMLWVTGLAGVALFPVFASAFVK